MTSPVRFAILGFGLTAVRRNCFPAFANSERTRLVGMWRRDQGSSSEELRRAPDYPLLCFPRGALCLLLKSMRSSLHHRMLCITPILFWRSGTVRQFSAKSLLR